MCTSDIQTSSFAILGLLLFKKIVCLWMSNVTTAALTKGVSWWSYWFTSFGRKKKKTCQIDDMGIFLVVWTDALTAELWMNVACFLYTVLAVESTFMNSIRGRRVSRVLWEYIQFYFPQPVAHNCDVISYLNADALQKNLVLFFFIKYSACCVLLVPLRSGGGVVKWQKIWTRAKRM